MRGCDVGPILAITSSSSFRASKMAIRGSADRITRHAPLPPLLPSEAALSAVPRKDARGASVLFLGQGLRRAHLLPPGISGILLSGNGTLEPNCTRLTNNCFTHPRLPDHSFLKPPRDFHSFDSEPPGSLVFCFQDLPNDRFFVDAAASQFHGDPPELAEVLGALPPDALTLLVGHTDHEIPPR
jgi:hypothetical protein